MRPPFAHGKRRADPVRAVFTRACSNGMLALVFLAAASSVLAHPSIIPIPAEVTERIGSEFTLNGSTRLLWRNPPDDARYVADFLGTLLSLPSNAELSIANRNERNAIILDFDPKHWPKYLRNASSPEAYVLDIDADRVLIHARTAHGAFNAAQTLRQLLPAAVENRALAARPKLAPVAEPRVSTIVAPCCEPLRVPALVVRDAPRYAWRGLLVDVSRHFFTVDEMKKFLDLMALHKLNTLHWHLTDDQGWRLEIKRYPRLTEVGSWRDETPMRGGNERGDRVRYGGYYTQAQIKEIVAYAAARFITIVPEIELPGHSSAALAAYPEFGSTDAPGYAPTVATRWGIFDNLYAPKEETFQFLENVFIEVMALFPGRYIHIGGDEAWKRQWRNSPAAQAFMTQQGFKDWNEVQGYFIRRIGSFLTAHGRTLIGWDEILESNAPTDAAVMVWRTTAENEKTPFPPASWENVIPALKAGHDVVLTPTSHFYLGY